MDFRHHTTSIALSVVEGVARFHLRMSSVRRSIGYLRFVRVWVLSRHSAVGMRIEAAVGLLAKPNGLIMMPPEPSVFTLLWHSVSSCC